MTEGYSLINIGENIRGALKKQCGLISLKLNCPVFKSRDFMEFLKDVFEENGFETKPLFEDRNGRAPIAHTDKGKTGLTREDYTKRNIEEKIIKYLKKTNKSYGREIADAIGHSIHTIHAALGRLIYKNKVEKIIKEGKGKDGKRHSYVLYKIKGGREKNE